MSRLRFATCGRVVVTRCDDKLGPAEIESLVGILEAAARTAGRPLLLVQLSSMRGGFSVHHVGRGDTTTVFARYAAALRAHVEQTHVLAPGLGLLGDALRGTWSIFTRRTKHPTLFHASLDELVETLRARHDVDPKALRACIAECDAGHTRA